jgi:hypothetical protein
MSTHHPRSGALMAGLILIAFGVIFLIESFNASFSAGSLIYRYWPLIPILIGVQRAFAFFTWEAIHPPSGNASSKE